jgi:hypothetical protein
MRNEVILKTACGLVLALVLYRLALALVHINPLYHVTIPALPSLASATNSTASKTATNATASATMIPTNTATHLATMGGTNTVKGTNSIALSTNVAAANHANLAKATNGPTTGTNEVALATNSIAPTTNNLAQKANRVPGLAGGKPGSDVATPQMMGANLPPGMPPGAFPGPFPRMARGAMPGMPGAGPALPPRVQAQIDRVIESEILAPVMRPLPMALLGIAGKDVFFRAPNGQTGLIKEGDELGGVKLIHIGVNRVLVEEQGQQQELTIFAGLGGESLLSKQKDSPK